MHANFDRLLQQLDDPIDPVRLPKKWILTDFDLEVTQLWEAYAHHIFLSNLNVGYANDSAHLDMGVTQHWDLLLDHRVQRCNAFLQLSQLLARLFLLRQ